MFRRMFILAACVCMVLPVAQQAAAVEKYTIKEMTPAVKAALENRRGRYDALEALKRQGQVGENNRGYVEAFSNDAAVKKLVDAENADRKVIYVAIVEQNNLQGALDTIEKVFAQTQRDNAEPGDKIQTEDGRWIQK